LKQGESRDDIAGYAEGLCCTITFGNDATGAIHCVVHDDALRRDDMRFYFKMARFLLNSHYKRMTGGKNCPLRDDGPADGRPVEGMELGNFIIIGVEGPAATAMKLVVPDHVAVMQGFPDYLERAIHALDSFMAARRLT
jgi:hypothetical protein